MIPAPPPAHPQELLAASDRRGRALFALVRRLVDEFEEAAPWELLYAPPVDLGELQRRISRLLDLVEAAPEAVSAELDRLASGGGGTVAEESREEAAFYFAALHQMTAADRRRLAAALTKSEETREFSRAEADFLAELAADLKGKYASAIMGAAAALVSNGRWLGPAVEATLFPEKAEERRRNRELLDALIATDRSLESVRRGFPWRQILDAWRAGQTVDRYALNDLVGLRAQLLTLLTVEHRRALYSGDFHLLQRRERELGRRLRELEELHLEAFERAEGTGEAEFARKVARLLEIAALLDVALLTDLVGKRVVSAARAGGSVSTAATAPEHAGLAALLAEEDLALFLQLLLGAVRKRTSIAFEDSPADAIPAAPRQEAPPTVEPAESVPAVLPRGNRNAAEVEARLVAVLDRLLHPSHEPWRAFQMVQKLQTRLRVLPPALAAEIRPLLSELREELQPLLDEAVAAGVLPAMAARTLRTSDERLAGFETALPQERVALGDDLGRVARLVRSLHSAFAAAKPSPRKG